MTPAACNRKPEAICGVHPAGGLTTVSEDASSIGGHSSLCSSASLGDAIATTESAAPARTISLKQKDGRITLSLNDGIGKGVVAALGPPTIAEFCVSLEINDAC